MVDDREVVVAVEEAGSAPRQRSVVRPAAVLWLGHATVGGPWRQELQRTKSGVTALTDSDIYAGARQEGLLPVAENLNLDLKRCEIFVMLSCSAGRVNPEFDREGYGLVRSLFSLGVRRVVGPNYVIEPKREVTALYAQIAAEASMQRALTPLVETARRPQVAARLSLVQTPDARAWTHVSSFYAV